MWIRLGLLLALLCAPVLAEAAAIHTTFQNAAAATGNGTTMTVEDKGAVGLSVSGTFVGTVTFEGSSDAAVTFDALTCTNVATLLSSTTATATGQYQCPVAGLSHFRVRVSAYTSGSITVAGTASDGSLGNIGTGGGGNVPTLAGCWATAAQPAYVEGYLSADSCTLAGLKRVSIEGMTILIEGEDQTNHLLQTSGGVVRLTTFSSVTSATTSSVTTVPIGVVNFMAYMGGASETKAFDITIYGNWQNSTTGGQPVCQLWVPSTASVTHIETTCKGINKPYTYWYYTATVYTSASSAPLTLYAQY